MFFLQELKEYFGKNVENYIIETKISEENDKIDKKLKKKKKNDVSLKYKGNQLQLKFNLELLERIALCEKFLYLKLFWSVHSRIRTEYGEIRHSAQMRENTD